MVAIPISTGPHSDPHQKFGRVKTIEEGAKKKKLSHDEEYACQNLLADRNPSPCLFYAI